MILLIVSTSDYVLSSRNHKHRITTRKQIQDYSLVCVMLCKMVMTGSCYAQQTHMSVCRCRAVGSYGYRNAVVLYPSPLSLYQSRPRPKQGTNIFYTFPGCNTTFCFSEIVNKWLASKLSTVKLSCQELVNSPKEIPRLWPSTVWATVNTLLCCFSRGHHHLGKSTSQDRSCLPRVRGNLKTYPFEAAVT